MTSVALRLMEVFSVLAMVFCIIFTHQKWNVCFFHESLFQFVQLSTTMKPCNLCWVARLHMSHSAVWATLLKTEPLILNSASPALGWFVIWIRTCFGKFIGIYSQCTMNSMDFRIAVSVWRTRLHLWHADSARCQGLGKFRLPAIHTFSPKYFKNRKIIWEIESTLHKLKCGWCIFLGLWVRNLLSVLTKE